MRTLRASAPDAESYRKARLLLYLQNRAERVKKDSGDADTQEKEKLSHAERFVEDSNCYQAAAFVFNPKENDLSSVFAGGFPDAGAVPKMRETLSYDELRKNIFSLRPPVLVSTYNEAIQQRYGGEAGATHHFVILDYDEKVEDFICFEKIRVDEPVQIVNLKQIYAGHSSSLWGLSKI